MKLALDESNNCLNGISKLWMRSTASLVQGDSLYLNFRGTSVKKVCNVCSEIIKL